MKKLTILFITIVLLTGCGKKEEKKDIDTKDIYVLEKFDKDKDYVYFDDIKSIKYKNGDVYNIRNAIVNIKGEVIDNINLELKNFVLNSYNSMKLNNDIIQYGNIIDYEYYEVDNYISLIQNYSFYINGNFEEKDSNIYVISLDNGKLLDNKDILKIFEYDENKLYEYLEKNILSDDISFTLMQIKNNGYSLYINNDKKMVIRYHESLNDAAIEKELIIN